MQILRGTPARRLHVLVTVGIMLGFILIALTALLLGEELLKVLGRFRQQIFMFVVGAILAYLMAPVVRVLKSVVRVRWLAVLLTYVSLLAALVLLGVLLANPFISQARGLVSHLHNPAIANLQSLRDLQSATNGTYSEIQKQLVLTSGNVAITSGEGAAVTLGIERIRKSLRTMQQGEAIRGRIRIPPSYLRPVAVALDGLTVDYRKALFANGSGVDANGLTRAFRDAQAVTNAEHDSYARAVTTPLLLLSLQVWLDERGVAIDLHDRFGTALQGVSNQFAGLLNNALGIALAAGNLTLETLLIVIISIYFLSAGKRFMDWIVDQLPEENQWRAQYFFLSLDKILGSYLRVQILMALLAAALDAIGAVVFGVPYAVVIFLSAFLLSLVPVIGPVILPVVPAFIAVVFAPFPKSMLFIAWVVLVEQVVTNVVGPRVQGQSLGIHPLEAMAAALVGFPIAGFLGSFFAVPAVAFLHVVVRSFAHARKAERSDRGPTISTTARIERTPPSS